jgi:hypothetical protein
MDIEETLFFIEISIANFFFTKELFILQKQEQKQEQEQEEQQEEEKKQSFHNNKKKFIYEFIYWCIELLLLWIILLSFLWPVEWALIQKTNNLLAFQIILQSFLLHQVAKRRFLKKEYIFSFLEILECFVLLFRNGLTVPF